MAGRQYSCDAYGVYNVQDGTTVLFFVTGEPATRHRCATGATIALAVKTANWQNNCPWVTDKVTVSGGTGKVTGYK